MTKSLPQVFPRWMNPSLLLLALMVHTPSWSAEKTTFANTGIASNPMDIGAPMIQRFGPKDYNALAMNWAVAQGKNGIMYFGNGSGLLEFDGVHWTTVQLKGDLGRSISVAADGTVYVGTLGDFGYLQSNASGKTEYISLSENLENAESFENVWSIHTTTHGVYFVTDSIIYRWFNNKMDSINSARRNFGSTAGDEVFIFFRDGGVAHLLSGVMTELPGTENFSSATSGRMIIAPYAPDKFLMVTTNSGSFIYHLDRFKNNESGPFIEPFKNEADAYLKKHSPYYFYTTTKNGDYIIPTLTGGIVIFNKQGKLQRIINDARGLKGGSIFDITLDQNENLWAATSNGLFHLEINSPWSVFDLSEISKAITLQTLRYGKNLYIVSYQGAFYLPEYQLELENDKHNFLQLNIEKDPSFAMLPLPNFLLIGIRHRLYRVNGIQTEKLIELDGAPLTISFATLKRFPDYIFSGLYSAGITAVKLKQTGDKYTATEIKLSIPELNPATPRLMLEDEQGDLWIATDLHGIYRLKFSGTSIHDYTLEKFGVEHGLPKLQGNSINKVHGKILAFNSDGVYQIVKQKDPKNPEEEIIHFSKDTGLSSFQREDQNTLLNVAEYGNDLYLETSNGVGLLQKQADGSYHWNTAAFREIPEDKNGFGGSYVDKNGVIWLSINTNLYRYNPSIRKDYAAPFNAVINKVIKNEEAIFYGAFAKTAQQRSTNIKESLPAFQYINNNLTFEYGATFYEHLSKMQYSHFLEGYDKNWSNWSSDAKKEYTNLSEGNYKFHVKAINIHGHESNEAIYGFTILAPWYRTTSAYIVYLILSLTIIYAITQIHSWQQIKARKRLEKIIKQRTLDLEISLDQLKKTQRKLTEMSHHAGMAEVARTILHNVGNVLNSVKTSSDYIEDQIKRPQLATKLKNTINLIRQHENDYANFFTQDAKGQKVPQFLESLTEKILGTESVVLAEVIRLKDGIKKIENITAAQEQHAHAAVVDEEVDIREVIETAIEMSELNEDDSITLHKDLQNLPLVYLERYRILSVLKQLINHARGSLTDKNQAKKEIRIEIKNDPASRLRFSISNNGAGIAADKLKTIFAQVADAQRSEISSDLHLCSNTIKEMGGVLQCQSAGLGQGATFYFDIAFKAVALRNAC